MNFDDYYLMYLGITPPSGDDSEEPEEDPKPTYFSSYVSVYVKPDPKPATTSKPTNGAADPAPANYGAPPPMYQGISSAPQPTSSSSNSSKKRDRKEETPGKPQITLPADFIQPTVAPDISAFDLEYGWWSEFGSRQPEVETDDELVGAVAKSVQNEGLFAHYLDDPIAYLKHFASYGWNAKSDRQAEAYLQKHREEMRLHYAGQDELWKGLALGATEHTRKDLTNDRLESAVAVNIVTKEEIFRRFGDEDETPLQEENREMIKDPYNTALVHNHWNDSPGSQADFDAALWLGVRYLIVVTPSGMQYIYERDGDTMKLLDEIFNREHVALPSRAETEESREAYEAQMLAEEGNPAERVMRQYVKDEVISVNMDSRLVREFFLDPAMIVFLEDVANEYEVEDPSLHNAMMFTIIYRELRAPGSLENADLPAYQRNWDWFNSILQAPSYLFWRLTSRKLPKLDGDPSFGIGALNREAIARIEQDSETLGMSIYAPLLGFDAAATFGSVPFSRGVFEANIEIGREIDRRDYSMNIVPPTNEAYGAWRAELPNFAGDDLGGIQQIYEPALGYIAAEVAIAMTLPEYKKLKTKGERIAFLIGYHANRSAKPGAHLYDPHEFSATTMEEIRWVEDFQGLIHGVRNEMQGGAQDE